MSTTITLPDHYGLVILCNVCGPFIVSGVILAGRVMAARTLHNVKYPNLYASPGHHDKADEFNQVQRGHQNMFETAVGASNISQIIFSLPSFGFKHAHVCSRASFIPRTQIFYIPMSIIAGVQHPLAVAFGGFCYCLGCVTYQSGYKKSPEDRNKGLGPIKYIGILTSLIVSVKLALTML